MRKSNVLLRRKCLLCCCLAIGLGAGANTTLAQVVPLPIDVMTEAYRVEVEAEISRVADKTANERSYFEQDMRPINIRASLNAASRQLIFDMDARFGPEAGYTEMVDLQHAVEEDLEEIRSRITGIESTIWRFGGKDIDYWMPVPKE